MTENQQTNGPFMSPGYAPAVRSSAAGRKAATVRSEKTFAYAELLWRYAVPSILLWILIYEWFQLPVSWSGVMDALWRGDPGDQQSGLHLVWNFPIRGEHFRFALHFGPPWTSYFMLGIVVAAAYAAWSLKSKVFDKMLSGRLDNTIGSARVLAWRAFPTALCAGLAAALFLAASGSEGHEGPFCFFSSLTLVLAALFAQFFYDLVLKGILRLDEKSDRIRLEPLNFGIPPGFVRGLSVAHLSDLHLTADENVPSVSGAPGGSAAFVRMVAAQLKPLESADSIFICGDVADAGRADEWDFFFRTYPEHLLSKTVLVPGNHDVNIGDAADRLALDATHVLRRQRLIRTMAAMDLAQGERAWVLTRRCQFMRLREYLAPLKGEFTAYIEDPPVPRYEENWRVWLKRQLGLKRAELGDIEEQGRIDLPLEIWEEIFPMAVELPGGKSVAFVLDSNGAASSILDNALGEISRQSLRKLCRFQRRYQGWAQLLLLHHHVALPHHNFGFLGNLQSDLMALLNTGDLMEVLSHSKGGIVFHGHKHISYVGQAKDEALGVEFQVVSAPSCTFGDELALERGKGYFVFDLAFSPDGQAVLAEQRFHRYAE